MKENLKDVFKDMNGYEILEKLKKAKLITDRDLYEELFDPDDESGIKETLSMALQRTYEKYKTEDSKRYQIPITFAVKSGDSFTGQYSNYMIRLDVALYTDYTASSDATKVDGSYDNDHVIWTNAKIIPRIVGPE